MPGVSAQQVLAAVSSVASIVTVTILTVILITRTTVIITTVITSAAVTTSTVTTAVLPITTIPRSFMLLKHVLPCVSVLPSTVTHHS